MCDVWCVIREFSPFSTVLESSGTRSLEVWREGVGFWTLSILPSQSLGWSASLQGLWVVSGSPSWTPSCSLSFFFPTLSRTGAGPAWRDRHVWRTRSQWGAGWMDVCKVWTFRPRTRSLLGPGAVAAGRWRTSGVGDRVLECRTARSGQGCGCRLTRIPGQLDLWVLVVGGVCWQLWRCIQVWEDSGRGHLATLLEGPHPRSRTLVWRYLQLLSLSLWPLSWQIPLRQRQLDGCARGL